MDLYVTVQGDCWDSLAFELYGDEKYMQLLIEANWPLLDYLVFPSGIEIYVPDLPDEEDEDAPFWRLEDDEGDDEDDFYSSVEYPDDEEDEDEDEEDEDDYEGEDEEDDDDE